MLGKVEPAYYMYCVISYKQVKIIKDPRIIK